ncbi:hypothetical protein ACHAPO_000290 [Fusarium lateritium]
MRFWLRKPGDSRLLGRMMFVLVRHVAIFGSAQRASGLTTPFKASGDKDGCDDNEEQSNRAYYEADVDTAHSS